VPPSDCQPNHPAPPETQPVARHVAGFDLVVRVRLVQRIFGPVCRITQQSCHRPLHQLGGRCSNSRQSPIAQSAGSFDRLDNVRDASSGGCLPPACSGKPGGPRGRRRSTVWWDPGGGSRPSRGSRRRRPLLYPQAHWRLSSIPVPPPPTASRSAERLPSARRARALGSRTADWRTVSVPPAPE